MIRFLICLRGEDVEFAVNMQPELMMNTIWIIIGGILLLIAAILFTVIIVFKMAPIKTKAHKKKPVAQRPKYVNSRQKALYEIDQIVFDLSKSNIDTRASYQRLSLIMREYLTETTGKDHTCLTLEEIKNLKPNDFNKVTDSVSSVDLRVTKIREFAALIEGCYYPEFALKSRRDFRIDAERAKRLVNTWG